MIGFERLAQSGMVCIGIDRQADVAVDQTLLAPGAWKRFATSNMAKKPLFERGQRGHAQSAKAGIATVCAPMRRA